MAGEKLECFERETRYRFLSFSRVKHLALYVMHQCINKERVSRYINGISYRLCLMRAHTGSQEHQDHQGSACMADMNVKIRVPRRMRLGVRDWCHNADPASSRHNVIHVGQSRAFRGRYIPSVLPRDPLRISQKSDRSDADPHLAVSALARSASVSSNRDQFEHNLVIVR